MSTDKPSKYQKAQEKGYWVYTFVVEKTNCTNPRGHHFSGVISEEEKQEIRKEHPSWRIALWKCQWCGKISESM